MFEEPFLNDKTIVSERISLFTIQTNNDFPHLGFDLIIGRLLLHRLCRFVDTIVDHRSSFVAVFAFVLPLALS